MSDFLSSNPTCPVPPYPAVAGATAFPTTPVFTEGEGLHLLWRSGKVFSCAQSMFTSRGICSEDPVMEDSARTLPTCPVVVPLPALQDTPVGMDDTE